MINLYNPDNTNFEQNGDVILTPISCDITAKLNDTWELSLLHPIDEEGRWKSIVSNAVLKVPSFNGAQLFRIVTTDKVDSGITATADPILYDAAQDVFLFDSRPTGKNLQEALDILLDGTRYTGQSDIDTVSTAYYINKNFMECLSGADNSILNRWGGEILFDNFKIIINERIGGDYGVSVLYAKNTPVDGVRENIDFSSVVTRIIPKAYDGYMLPGDSPWVDSPLIDTYPTVRTKVYEYSDLRLRSTDDTEEEEGATYFDTEDELYDAMRQAAANEFVNGADKPDVNISIDMVLLENTEEYKAYKDLVKVSLGDTIICKHSKLGIDSTARIIGLVYDSLRDHTVSVEIGEAKANFINQVAATVQSVSKALTPGGNVIAEQIQGIIDGAYAQLRLQNTIAKKQDVRAILFEDLDPDSPTYGALSIGTQGFQISRKRTEDSRDWIWTTAATSEGIIGGTIIAQDQLIVSKHFYVGSDGYIHITEIENDYTSGNNVLVDSDSIDIRKGETTVASFGEETRIGEEDKAGVEFSPTTTKFYGYGGATVGRIGHGETGAVRVDEDFGQDILQALEEARQIIIPLKGAPIFVSEDEPFLVNAYIDNILVGRATLTNYQQKFLTNTTFDYSVSGYIVQVSNTGKLMIERPYTPSQEGVPEEWTDHIEEFQVIYYGTGAFPTFNFGVGNEVTGNNGFAIGESNIVSGDRAFAMGLDNSATGLGSFVGGEDSHADGVHSFAFGDGLKAGDKQFVIGSYNEVPSDYPDMPDNIFVIGGGIDDEDRSDIFAIDLHGNVSSGGNITMTHPDTNALTTITNYDGGEYGNELVINNGGNLIIGSGEFPNNFHDSPESVLIPSGVEIPYDSQGERTYVGSDGQLFLITNANTIANSKVWIFEASGNTQFPNNIYMQNSKEIQWRDTGNNYKAVLQLNANNNIVLGYGNYSSQEGDTNIYGNAVNVISRGNFTVNSANNILTFSGGSISLKQSNINLAAANNGVSAITYPGVWATDKDGAFIWRLEGRVYTNGDTGFFLYARNKDSSGNVVGTKGLAYTLTKANVGTWTVNDPASFRSAIGVGTIGTKNSLVEADIPNLNASKITAGTLPVARGGTGSTAFGTVASNNSNNVSVANAGNGTRLATVTLAAGKWLVECGAQWSANSTGARKINLGNTDGTYQNNVLRSDTRQASSHSLTEQSFTYISNQSAQTVWYLNAWQNSGSALTCMGYIYAIRLA